MLAPARGLGQGSLPCMEARSPSSTQVTLASHSCPGGEENSIWVCCVDTGGTSGYCFPFSQPLPCLCSGSLHRIFLWAQSLLENWKTTTAPAQSAAEIHPSPSVLVWVCGIRGSHRGKYGLFCLNPSHAGTLLLSSSLSSSDVLWGAMLLFFYSFLFKRYRFSGAALSPLVLWSLHTSKHMQRYERRPSASQFILLTLIYFLSPSATAQLPVCACVHACVCEGGKGKGHLILVEPQKISPLWAVAFPSPSYRFTIYHCSGHITLLPILLLCGKINWCITWKKQSVFLVLMQDARVVVTKLMPYAKPRLNTSGKAAVLPSALKAPKWKATASTAWAELHGWKQRQMQVICGSSREGDT